MAGQHIEHHFTGSERVRDIVIGMADGLTVPFALAAGISGTAAGMQVVVTAGLAELAAGAIAMGLGGYLAANSERAHYFAEQLREEQEIVRVPQRERAEIIEIMARYGMNEQDCAPLLLALERNPQAWRDFMMRFELGLEEPGAGAARNSAVTIACAYVAGGLVPLSPYLVMHDIGTALLASCAVTLLALIGFGYFKGKFSGANPTRSALQTLVVGALAAAAAFAVARLISP